MTKEEFQKKLLEHIKKNYLNFKEIRMENSGEDFGVVVKINSETHTIFLSNFYKEATQNNFQNWEKQIDNLLSFESTKALSRELTWEEAKDKIFPQIKNVQFFQAANSRAPSKDQYLVGTPFAGLSEIGICLVIDLPQQMIYVNEKNLKEWGKTLNEVIGIAIANLRQHPGTQQGLTRRDFKDGSIMFFSNKNDSYDAARLLLLEKESAYNLFASELGENFVVGIPHRDLFVAVPYALAPNLREKIAEEYKKGHHTISPKLFIITRKGPVEWKERSD